jgi:transcriptional regulator with XRE-family HTH domain
MTVVERIKESAKKRGYNLKTTALKAGLSENAIYSWQKYTPSSDKLAAVADVLHVSVDYLLGNTDDPNPAPKAGKPKAVDLADRDVPMTFEGRPVSDEDRAIFEAILRRHDADER